MALKARLETMLETLLSQADDPAERVAALVHDLRRRQAEGRRALGISLALEKRLLDDVVEAEDEVAAWETESKAALARGDEQAAHEAAAKVLAAQPRLDERRERHREQKELATKVRAAVLEAARRTQEVAHAKSVLLARSHCAQALQSIAQTLVVLESPELKAVQLRLSLAVEAKEAAVLRAG